MSNKQAKRIKTTYDHFSYKHIDYVREIHSTDTNIFRTVKRTIPTTLTWTSNPGYPIHWHPWIKQNQKHLYMCFHQTFSLDPLWFFAYSRIGSGHVIIWKTAADEYKPPSTTKNKKQHSQNTNMQRIHKHVHVPLVSHVCPTHPLVPPRVDPSRTQPNEIPRPLSRSAFHLSFSAEHRYLKRRQRIHDG